MAGLKIKSCLKGHLKQLLARLVYIDSLGAVLHTRALILILPALVTRITRHAGEGAVIAHA